MVWNALSFAAIEVCDENATPRNLDFNGWWCPAAVLGPNLAIMSQQWSQDGLYIGAFASLIGLNILALVILQTIQFPKVSFSHQAPRSDPLSAIVKAPNFVGAVFAAMVAYAVMNILMTATPPQRWLAVVSTCKAAGVIEWHVLGMFVPAFYWVTHREVWFKNDDLGGWEYCLCLYCYQHPWWVDLAFQSGFGFTRGRLELYVHRGNRFVQSILSTAEQSEGSSV